MRILVRNAGRWFGPRSVGPRHLPFPLARTNGPRLCDCASENYRDLPDSEARALIGRGARAGSLKSRVRARHRAKLCADPLDALRNVDYATAPPAAIATALRGASAPCTAQRPAWHRSGRERIAADRVHVRHPHREDAEHAPGSPRRRCQIVVMEPGIRARDGAFEWPDIGCSYAQQWGTGWPFLDASPAPRTSYPRHSGARFRANPESRDSPMCNCTSEVRAKTRAPE